ncbi:MAG: cytochrome c [Nitrospinae bacterium]|nr:cytochrome c [Nitrospinota bacterium]
MRFRVIATFIAIVTLSVPAMADLAEKGQKLFLNKKYRCATCHGKRGQGGIGPAFQGIGAKYSQDELMKRAAHNCPPTGSCNPKELNAIITYLRTL